ncbi:BCCT family transporter [Chitinophaga solisilvae]|uniref:BCCT family transporter n=1 Tax=Chitinophaga solisilvae TaxID=1233460 RepID=A0A3S1CWR9_9BACT|nr:BCCT family transporter [Chitinophaga solisilvae]NSL86862.1 BCCT family transporter [Chitinophaga solisilvae]
MPKRTAFVINKPVFYVSGLLVLFSLLLCLLFRQSVDEWFARTQYLVTENMGWFFILTVNFVLIFCLALAFGKYGRIRLGGEHAEPEFSKGSWFAMLFSAGMGIGIMFFSVAEPVSHFAKPPRPVATPIEAARQAMDFTFLHWGLHAWGIYALVGLSLAFFSFNKKLPLTFRSLFYPFLGERIHGWWGHSIDILSVLATLFGLSTSLGLGVQQMNAGMNFLFGWPVSVGLQSILIIVVTCIATLSVFSGLDKGVKILSNANMVMALTLMLLIFLLGPTIYLLKSYIQNIGTYLADFIQISTWNDSYRQSGWQNSWTVFYWAWWIAWSPFVGSFIARISKGRTVREFILGVLIVPALLTLLWMTIFGSTALSFILHGDDTMIAAVKENISTALFVFLRQFPLTQVLSLLAVLLVSFFFITSSDSGSLVVDNITSGGSPHTPVLQRILWAFVQGIIAIVLLWGGGLQALQTAVIIAGLPFAVIILLMCYSLQKGLQEELTGMHKKLRQKQEKSYRNIISDIIQEQNNSND